MTMMECFELRKTKNMSGIKTIKKIDRKIGHVSSVPEVICICLDKYDRCYTALFFLDYISTRKLYEILCSTKKAIKYVDKFNLFMDILFTSKDFDVLFNKGPETPSYILDRAAYSFLNNMNYLNLGKLFEDTLRNKYGEDIINDLNILYKDIFHNSYYEYSSGEPFKICIRNIRGYTIQT